MSEGGGQGLTSGRKTGLKPLPTNKTDAKGKNMGQSPNFGRSSQRHAGHKTQGEKNGSERASQLTQTAKLTFVFNCDKVPDGNKAELECVALPIMCLLFLFRILNPDTPPPWHVIGMTI